MTQSESNSVSFAVPDGPFAQAAHAYLRSGLGSPLPLGRIGEGPAKEPPPAGWTGGSNPDASGADVQAWIEDGRGGQNIALRLAAGIVVTDVDSYKGPGGRASTPEERAAILADFAALGLPATVTSTSRGADSPDRHHVFRYDPADMAGRVFKNPCTGVDILHHGWRYMMAAPSLHPTRGTAVRWYAIDGTEIDGVPTLADLPMLTREQVHALSKPGMTSEKAQLGDDESLSWLGMARDGAMCAPVRGALVSATDELVLPGARRHDTTNAAALTLVRYAGQGHRGAVSALVALRDEYFKVTAGEKRDTAGEWARGLHGAVAIVARDTPRPAVTCRCDPPAPGYLEIPAGLGAAEPERPEVFDMMAELAAVTDAPLGEQVTAAFGLMERLASRERSERESALAYLKEFTSLPITALRKAMDEEVKARKERAAEEEKRALSAEKAEKIAEAQNKGTVLPDPGDPMAVARRLEETFPRHDGVVCVSNWRGDFYVWTGTHWTMAATPEIRDQIYHRTELAQYVSGEDLKDWRPTIAKVNGVLDALSTLLRRPAAADDDRVIACTNGVLDLASGELRPHAPATFNLRSLPYAYDPAATCPQWLAFLESSLPGDEEAKRFLQEWAGYLISGDMRQQKIACLVGKKRGGKGTVSRTLKAMLGTENVTGATLNSIAGNFGLEPLIGKSMAELPDVSWKVRNAAEGAEVLKMVSGQDGPPVHRKGRLQWEGQLGVRFTIMTNDTPTFQDASGALAGRLIIVRFGQSFFGREDITLTERLHTELSGILNWALEGLARLNARGHFVEPSSSGEVRQEMERASAKLRGFLDDDTVKAQDAPPVELDDVYEAYIAWCEDEQRDHPVAKSNFGRELSDEGITVTRDTKNREVDIPGRPRRPRWVHGLAPVGGAWRRPKLGKGLVSGKPGYLV